MRWRSDQFFQLEDLVSTASEGYDPTADKVKLASSRPVSKHAFTPQDTALGKSFIEAIYTEDRFRCATHHQKMYGLKEGAN